VFHAVPNGRDPVRLIRVGRMKTSPSGGGTEDMGILALSGPNVWIWRSNAFHVLDMREW
jgi:hypothetical protein